MRKVIRELIDLAVDHDGRFFPAYQLHYTTEQLRASYLTIAECFAHTRPYDPSESFATALYEMFAPKT